MKSRITVTIARQLGCGGSYVGQRVAAGLGCRCIDREIISRTAQEFGLDEAELAAREERVSSFWVRMLGGLNVVAPEAPYVAPPFPSVSDKEIFEDETEVMQAIAAQEDCVIVGRAAAHVLSPHAGMVNVFLYAPLRFRIPRAMEFYQASSEAQARSLIEHSDAVRRKFIAQRTGRDWACATNYHLCIDTSLLPLDAVADLLVEYVRRRVQV